MYKKSDAPRGKHTPKNSADGFRSKENEEKGKPFQYKGDKKPYDKPFKRNSDRPYSSTASDKPYDRKPKPSGDHFKTDSNQPRFEKTDGPKPFPKREGPRPFPKKEGGSFHKDTDRPFKRNNESKEDRRPAKFEKRGDRNSTGKPSFKEKREFKPYEKDTKQGIVPRIEDKAFKPKKGESINKVFNTSDKDRSPKKRTEKNDEKRPFKKPDGKPAPFERRKPKPAGVIPDAAVTKGKRKDDDVDEVSEEVKPEAMPLNKYIAHCGVCSRRDAAILVKEGKVKINDLIITDPGHKVTPNDVVSLNDKKLTVQKGMVYILLNKPKDYITTNDDPQGRKTVMELLVGADAERLFPVGRLDRNTTGLLLITNDGALTQKLAHPSYKVKKIYQATLDKPLTKADSEKIIAGVTLEDGVAHVDTLAYLESKNELGLEIHSGRNRIVRRIFESLGYEVVKLDRMMYGGLTKKNLPRGKWRYLNEREIVLLKHFKS